MEGDRGRLVEEEGSTCCVEGAEVKRWDGAGPAGEDAGLAVKGGEGRGNNGFGCCTVFTMTQSSSETVSASDFLPFGANAFFTPYSAENIRK